MNVSCMSWSVLLSVFVLLVAQQCCSAAKKSTNPVDDSGFLDSPLTLELQHAIGLSDDFVTRGVVSVKSLRSSSSVGFQQEHLSHAQLLSLRESARNNGFYRIRARSKFTNLHDDDATPESVEYVSTFIGTCALINTRLSDVITVSGDGNGNVIGLSVAMPGASDVVDCEALWEVPLPSHFNTSISLDSGTPGPVPDTQGFLEKHDKEEREKQTTDNRSFFQKYWLYIVIAFLVFQLIGGGLGGGGG